MKFSEWLRTRNSSEKQGALARTLEISDTHLSRLKLGKRVPSRELAVRIERLTDGLVRVDEWDGEALLDTRRGNSGPDTGNAPKSCAAVGG